MLEDDDPKFRPMIRWAGSKRRALKSMTPFFPSRFAAYVEPFCGSACVFYNLNPKKAALNDINSELISFYQTARSKPRDVYSAFRKFRRSKDSYYRIRSSYHQTTDRIQRAAKFFFLNRNCFNGLYRTNKSGVFNVPFSSSRVANYPTADEFEKSITRLCNASLACSDFEKFCDSVARRGDFVYFDPPYYLPNSRIFLDYQPSPFCLEDFGRLSELLQRLDNRGILFLLSYPDCVQVRDIRSLWNTRRIRVQSSVAGKVESRGPKYEYLLNNYDEKV